MRESQFIKQNEKKWRSFETELKNSKRNSDKLSDVFIQLTDDLSYSRTFYKNRTVRYYLNGLAMDVFKDINIRKKASLANFKKFWFNELPLLMHQSRKEFLFIFSCFTISLLIGILSSNADSKFAGYILGEEYIQTTLNNINKNDPMAIYKSQNQTDMFLGITLNNIRVALLSYLTGLFFSLGTVLFIMYNGVMVGVFQNFFVQKGLFIVSFLTIWMHGALEIPAILIAGTAGIALGNSILIPGTYTRIQSLQIGGKRSFKIFCGIIPIIVLAAIVESFITRYTEIPNAIRLLFISVEFIFIYLYYIWFPNKLYKSGKRLEEYENRIPPNEIREIKLTDIKTNGEILFETFFIYKSNFKRFLLISIIAAAGCLVTLHLINPDFLTDNFFYGNQQAFIAILNINEYPLQIIILFALFIISAFYTNQIGLKQLKLNTYNFKTSYITSIALSSIIFSSCFFISNSYGLLALCLSLLPILINSIQNTYLNNEGVFKSLSISISQYFNSFINVAIINFIIFFFLLTVLFLSNTSVVKLPLEFIEWNIPHSGAHKYIILNILYTFLSFLIMFMIFPLFFIAFQILHFSLREKETAKHLISKINNIGKKSEF